MNDTAAMMFPEIDNGPQERPKTPTTGILPNQQLRELVRHNEIFSPVELDRDQIQPASLDLRLGTTAYRVQASFLPGETSSVEQKIHQFGMHKLELNNGAVLEKGCVYIVPLLEQLALPSRISGLANPKSSTGRLDVFTRLITNHGEQFDTVPEGYNGPLYLEVSPRTFSIAVKTGSRLNQLRLRRGTQASIGANATQRLHDDVGLIGGTDAKIRRGSLLLSVDLIGDPETRLVGYKARRHTGVIDIDKVGAYEIREFWEPIYNWGTKSLILDQTEFYVLASKESVSVPADHAAEMVAYDTLVGEFRVHYAGFFDPGFGLEEAGGRGSRAVLEVRSHEVPFLVEDGQVVGRLEYQKLSSKPDSLYGQVSGSNYQSQGLKLSKHFKPPS